MKIFSSFIKTELEKVSLQKAKILPLAHALILLRAQSLLGASFLHAGRVQLRVLTQVPRSSGLSYEFHTLSDETRSYNTEYN